MKNDKEKSSRSPNFNRAWDNVIIIASADIYYQLVLWGAYELFSVIACFPEDVWSCLWSLIILPLTIKASRMWGFLLCFLHTDGYQLLWSGIALIFGDSNWICKNIISRFIFSLLVSLNRGCDTSEPGCCYQCIYWFGIFWRWEERHKFWCAC